MAKNKKKFKKEVLKVGEWLHDSAPGGKLKFTKDYLEMLADNFNKYNPFAPVIRGHQDHRKLEENPDLIVAPNILALRVEGDSLLAEWEMDPTELEKYADISVGIVSNYVEHKTGKNIGDIIDHIALVVSPYLKTLTGFTQLGEDNKHYFILLNDIMNEETKTEETVEVTTETSSEDQPVEETTTEVVEDEVTEPEVEETKEEEPKEEVTEEVKEEEKVEVVTEEMKAELSEIKKQKIELEEKVRTYEANNLYNTYLSEGKLLPSMKDGFMKLVAFNEQKIELSDGEVKFGEALASFLKAMPTLVNLSEKGIRTDDAPKTDLDLSPNLYEDLKSSYMARNPKATEQEFSDYVKTNLDVIKKYDNIN